MIETSNSIRDNKSIPVLQTDRLILRKFEETDLPALFRILSDKTANEFLPWFPVKNMQETRKFYEERYVPCYETACGYAYAVCQKNDQIPIGYIGVSSDDSHDMGYGLRTEYWHRGIMTEAGEALVAQAREDGLPYITATHDRKNPRSGAVMQKLGMRYCYSYEEQWQPKNIPVIFRMYQLNFTQDKDFVYPKYWNQFSYHFIETISALP